MHPSSLLSTPNLLLFVPSPPVTPSGFDTGRSPNLFGIVAVHSFNLHHCLIAILLLCIILSPFSRVRNNHPITSSTISPCAGLAAPFAIHIETDALFKYTACILATESFSLISRYFDSGELRSSAPRTYPTHLHNHNEVPRDNYVLTSVVSAIPQGNVFDCLEVNLREPRLPPSLAA